MGLLALSADDDCRLGRDPALSNQAISLVEKSGAEVYLASAPHPIGQSSIGQRYIHAIQAVRAQEDQRRRVEYHARGTRARVRTLLRDAGIRIEVKDGSVTSIRV